MFNKEKVMKGIRDNKEIIQRFGVKKIGLFGSFVRNGAKKRSDIDLLVEFKRNCETFDNYFELKFFLEKLFKRKVDLVVKDTLKPRIKRDVLKDIEYARI